MADSIPQRRIIGLKERRAICREYDAGTNMPALAKKYQYADSTISRIVHEGYVGTYTPERWRAYQKIVWPGLRRWFVEAGASFCEVARYMGVTDHTIGKYLRGITEMPKSAIDALLQFTGLSYERAFYAGTRYEEARE